VTWGDLINMWMEFKKVSNLMTAEIWKEAIEAEGLPVKILPDEGLAAWSYNNPFTIYVPKGKEHVAEEILRKL
jgi:hypothetical protein